MIRFLIAPLTAALLSAAAAQAAETSIVAPNASDDLTENLEAASLSRRSVNEGVTDGQELLAAAKADYKRMVAALYEEGYYSGKVSILVDGREASSLSLLGNAPTVNRIEIRVEPGPQFRFSRADIAPLPQGAEPAEGYGVGDVAATPVIRQAAEQGVEDWRQDGHAKARVSGQQITAIHPRAAVSSRIDLAPGPRLRFGRTILTAETERSAVRAERIRAIAGIPEGETFDPDEIDTAERRLRRTGAFRSAVVNESEAPNGDGTLDMIIDTEDAKPRRFGFGVEISSTEGLAASAYWMHRNFFGGAERFRVDGSVSGIGGTSGGINGRTGASSGIDYGISASLTRPAFLGPDQNLRFQLNLEHLDEPSYTSDLAEASVGIERFITEDLTVALDVGGRFSHVEDAFGTRNFYHAIANGTATLDKRNDDFDPSKGYYIEVGALPFVGLDGSETGARLWTDLRGYVPLGTDRFVLAGRVQAGSLQFASQVGTPPEYLFFSGGGGTVRGQDYQSLGGSLAGGRIVGGRSFVGVTGEVRAKLTDKFGAVAFADYGYVSSDPNFSGGDYHAGAGLGGRYYTPIGPIRVDVAVPVTGESGFGVYVGIGQSF